MNWIETYPGFAVTLAGAVFAVVGYYYRAWREQQDNFREALYLLLEIWHRFSTVFNSPINELIGIVVARLEVRLGVQFSEQEKAAIRTHFMPILENTMRKLAMEGVESLHGAYDRVVQLISRSDPLLAYDLAAASAIKRGLAFIDQCLEEAFRPLDAEGEQAKVFADSLREGAKAKVETEALEELEKNLRRVAMKLGILAWLKVVLRIRSRRRLLEQGPRPEEFDQLLEQVLVPAISASNSHIEADGLPFRCDPEQAAAKVAR